jgi:hypothetical protein
MSNSVTFSRNNAYGIGFLLDLDMIRRVYFLRTASPVGSHGSLLSIAFGFLAFIGVLSSLRYFSASTARNMIYCFSGGLFLVTMASVARYFGWSNAIVPLEISILSFEFLAIVMCWRHIRETRRET